MSYAHISAIKYAALDIAGDARNDAHWSALDAAIEAAMSHAYAEGRADQAEDDAKLTGRLFEKAARLMNETGQGEHMGLTK